MKKICYDIKIAIIKSYEENILNAKEISSLFNVSCRTIYNYVAKYRNNISLENKKYDCRNHKITDKIKIYITNHVLCNIIFNIKDMIKNIKELFNVLISKTSIYNVLKSSSISYKKIRRKNYFEDKNNENIIRKFKENIIQNVSKDKLISIDESHVCAYSTPLYGWNNKGKKLIVKDFKSLKSKKYSLLCAINNKHVIAYKLYNGPIKAVDFKDFLEKFIYKNEYKNHSLILDNARIHHAKILKSNKQLSFIYNVPYSPELNPIEKVFSIIKSVIRNNFFKTNNDLTKLIDQSFDKIHEENMLDSFYNSSLGYK